jgi:membrane-bound lytic murein transglycosylase B
MIAALLLSALALAVQLADTPADLAAQLTAAEHTIRDPAATPADAAEAGHTQQVAYRAMVRDSTLSAAVIAASPDDVRPIVETNLAATASIMGTVGRRRVSMPAWQIVAPISAAELQAHYQAAEAEFGVPWEILAAIHLVETRMGRLRGISSANARGPMQFIPETWARFGEGDIEDARDAIFAAARHLKHHGAPERIDKALWHYNPTDRYVNAVRGYASLIEADPLAYRGYYGWQVYYTTVRGYVHLPEGYALSETQPVSTWCDAAPGRCPDNP